MTPYYPFWVVLIALSLCASLGGFLWAYRHRQFIDQERARYLPLRNEAIPASGLSRPRVNRELLALAGVLAIGVAAILVTLFEVILKHPGS